jgi:hypothetical protein
VGRGAIPSHELFERGRFTFEVGEDDVESE